MTSELLTDQGLDHGRDWDTMGTDESPLEWTLDHRQGLIQGPLDLEFLRGRKMSLILETGQMALLIQEEGLKAVYLDGAHYLDIGHGTHQVPADSSLLFLAADRHINLNWSRSEPLNVGRDHDQALIGGCSLAIEAPARFFRTFLDTPDTPDPEFLVRLVDQVVRGALEDLLGTMLEGVEAGAHEGIQSRLTRLTPTDLADELEPCGLACVNLAVYTAAPPVENEFTGRIEETTGHLDGVRHN